MKGTVCRGMTLAGDRVLRAALADSEKDRAENAMIVDMMRNDIGRIARRGSLRVTSAFDVEKYPTLFQMTSTVTAETAAPFNEIMRASFPPLRLPERQDPHHADHPRVGSGRAGRLYGLHRLPGARPEGDGSTWPSAPSASIGPPGRPEYGVGGGIVWDSATAEEYAECHVKAALLTAESPRFELLETMLHEADRGWFLLEGHLKRLSESAQSFDFAIDLNAIRKRLDELAERLTGDYRVRLLVGRRGECRTECRALADPSPSDSPPAVSVQDSLVPRQSGPGVSAPSAASIGGSPGRFAQRVPLPQDHASPDLRVFIRRPRRL